MRYGEMIEGVFKEFCGAVLKICLFELDASSCSDTVTCTGDPLKKARIVLEAILKPIILGREPDEHSGRLSMPRDNDLFLLRITKVPGKIVFSFVKRDLSHFSLPHLSQPALSLFV
jgi:hypothetical protein